MKTALATLLTLVLFSSAPGLAQTHAIFTGLGTQPSSISDWDVTARRLHWELPRVFFFHNWMVFRPPAITGDGRFALWPVVNQGFVPGVVVRDLTTGAMTASVLPPSLISFPFDSTTIVLAHPRRYVMYLVLAGLLAGAPVLIAEPTGFGVVSGCFRPFDAAVTLDGSRLFIACDDKRILVIDTVSETLLREFALPNQTIRLEVNHDGSRLATLDFAGTALRDADTGELLAFAAAPNNLAVLMGLHSNADRTELYASFTMSAGRETQVLSFDSFARLATLPVLAHSPCPERADDFVWAGVFLA